MSRGIAIGGMRYNQVQLIALCLVWFAFSISGIVYFEPAPFDGVMVGLIGLLPIVGLCVLAPSHFILMALLFAICAGGYLSAALSVTLGVTTIFNTITLFLCLKAVVIAGFIYKNPNFHSHLLLSAYSVAALVAAVAGIVGYFQLIPALGDLFTHHSRAAGTFKDANVFGPFIIPVILYAFYLGVYGSMKRAIIPGALMMVLTFALLLTFSRGAWLHFATSLCVFVYLAFVTARTNAMRVKLLSLVFLSVAAGAIVVGVALQSKSVNDLFKHRAALTHSYDVGPNGRFGGQQKAAAIIVDNPMGIGAGVFGLYYHHEQPHNNYLTMFLRTGWLGGFAYLFLIAMTLALGFRHALRKTNSQGVFLVVYASFVGLCLENVLVETDHWRHFFLLLGMIWGAVATEKASESASAPETFVARGEKRALNLAGAVS